MITDRDNKWEKNKREDKKVPKKVQELRDKAGYMSKYDEVQNFQASL